MEVWIVEAREIGSEQWEPVDWGACEQDAQEIAGYMQSAHEGEHEYRAARYARAEERDDGKAE